MKDQVGTQDQITFVIIREPPVEEQKPININMKDIENINIVKPIPLPPLRPKRI